MSGVKEKIVRKVKGLAISPTKYPIHITKRGTDKIMTLHTVAMRMCVGLLPMPDSKSMDSCP